MKTSEAISTVRHFIGWSEVLNNFLNFWHPSYDHASFGPGNPR